MNKIDCILLVDDDHPTNFFNSIIIEDADCANNIVIRQDAKEALEYLKTGFDYDTFIKPNLILLDINMPGMNGWEFLEKLKTIDTNQYNVLDIVIVILSTSLNPDDRTKAVEHHLVKDFINKPLSEEKIEYILDKFF